MTFHCLNRSTLICVDPAPHRAQKTLLNTDQGCVVNMYTEEGMGKQWKLVAGSTCGTLSLEETQYASALLSAASCAKDTLKTRTKDVLSTCTQKKGWGSSMEIREHYPLRRDSTPAPLCWQHRLELQVEDLLRDAARTHDEITRAERPLLRKSLPVSDSAVCCHHAHRRRDGEAVWKLVAGSTNVVRSVEHDHEQR